MACSAIMGQRRGAWWTSSQLKADIRVQKKRTHIGTYGQLRAANSSNLRVLEGWEEARVAEREQAGISTEFSTGQAEEELRSRE